MPKQIHMLIGSSQVELGVAGVVQTLGASRKELEGRCSLAWFIPNPSSIGLHSSMGGDAEPRVPYRHGG
jgi:hypothetical protein